LDSEAVLRKLLKKSERRPSFVPSETQDLMSVKHPFIPTNTILKSQLATTSRDIKYSFKSKRGSNVSEKSVLFEEKLINIDIKCGMHKGETILEPLKNIN